jgi:hypothetical protein
MNTAPRCGVLQYQTKAKVSNNKQRSYGTKRCNQLNSRSEIFQQ